MRDVTVHDIQKAIADIQAFSESVEICPEWARILVKEIAHLLECILSAREFPLSGQ